MVMKDKLVKNHHKGIYFTLKRWTLVLLASATFIVAIVVPTYIAAHMTVGKQASVAEEEPAVVEVAKDDEDDGEKETEDNPTESDTPYEFEEYNEPHRK